MSKKKIISLAVGVIIVAGIAIWAFGGQAKKRKVVYETATVDRANISNSVTATGTIEPVTEVEVGTQVSGIIDRLYADYNSVVTKGQLIAEMDKVTLQSELASQKATYDGAKAEYEYQQKNYERNKGLHEKQLISDTDYEQSLYNYQKAKSAFDSSKASLAESPAGAGLSINAIRFAEPHPPSPHSPFTIVRTELVRSQQSLQQSCR